MPLTQKWVGIKVFGLWVVLHFWVGFYIWGFRGSVVGGSSKSSYNRKNQTLIFKNLKKLKKVPNLTLNRRYYHNRYLKSQTRIFDLLKAPHSLLTITKKSHQPCKSGAIPLHFRDFRVYDHFAKAYVNIKVGTLQRALSHPLFYSTYYSLLVST